MGHNVSKYRVDIHQKKTYWHIFTWLLEVTVQKAWCLHRKTGESMSLFQFRREIAMHNLKAFGEKPFTSRSRQSRVGERARFEGRNY